MICGKQERTREGLAGLVLDDRQEHDCSCGEPDALDVCPKDNSDSTTIYWVALPPTPQGRSERGLRA
jgi:hypothetical protein